MGWAEANDYVLLHVFQFLGPGDLKRAACVCRRYRIRICKEYKAFFAVVEGTTPTTCWLI
jgi:hypothetical protein